MALQGEVPEETRDFLGSVGLTTVGSREEDGGGAGVREGGSPSADAHMPRISAPRVTQPVTSPGFSPGKRFVSSKVL